MGRYWAFLSCCLWSPRDSAFGWSAWMLQFWWMGHWTIFAGITSRVCDLCLQCHQLFFVSWMRGQSGLIFTISIVKLGPSKNTPAAAASTRLQWHGFFSRQQRRARLWDWTESRSTSSGWRWLQGSRCLQLRLRAVLSWQCHVRRPPRLPRRHWWAGQLSNSASRSQGTFLRLVKRAQSVWGRNQQSLSQFSLNQEAFIMSVSSVPSLSLILFYPCQITTT